MFEGLWKGNGGMVKLVGMGLGFEQGKWPRKGWEF